MTNSTDSKQHHWAANAHYCAIKSLWEDRHKPEIRKRLRWTLEMLQLIYRLGGTVDPELRTPEGIAAREERLK